MRDRPVSTPTRLRPALVLALALGACQGGSEDDPCQGYRAYENVIHDAAEWQAFARSGCTVVQGHLTLLAGTDDPANPPAVEEVTGGVAISLAAPSRAVALPRLRTIGAALLVGESGQEAIRLPALTSVGQHVSLWNNGGLRSIDLQALATVGGGSFRASSNAALGSVDLPALTELGTLMVYDNATLARLSLPALATVGYLDVGGDPALATLDLAALIEVSDGANLSELPALTAIDLPALRSVGTVQYGAGLILWRLGGATRISMPALRGVQTSLEVEGNAALETLSVPALEQVGSLLVRANPDYPECQGLALRDRLLAMGGLEYSIVDGNDATAICAP